MTSSSKRPAVGSPLMVTTMSPAHTHPDIAAAPSAHTLEMRTDPSGSACRLMPSFAFFLRMTTATGSTMDAVGVVLESESSAWL